MSPAKTRLVALARMLVTAVLLGGCAGHHDDDDQGGAAGNGGAAGSGTGGAGGTSGTSGMGGASGAGTGGTGGMGGAGGTSGTAGDAGTCDERGCWVSLTQFQAEALHCAATYELAETEYRKKPGEDCVSAFFECGGLRGAAYQYGFTGDNVQCYYGDDGALAGAVRTSDHGPSTVAGDIPEARCYQGPDCGGAGVDPDLRSCEVNSDCTIVTKSCCPCGPTDPSAFEAIAVDRAEAFWTEQCPPPIACPPVFCSPEPPRVVATCNAGTCEVVDLHEQAALECDAPTDCSVRAVQCCECGASGAPGTLVAVSDRGAFASLVCGADQSCPECEPIYPAEATATCSTSGLCELRDTRE